MSSEKKRLREFCPRSEALAATIANKMQKKPNSFWLSSACILLSVWRDLGHCKCKGKRTRSCPFASVSMCLCTVRLVAFGPRFPEAHPLPRVSPGFSLVFYHFFLQKFPPVSNFSGNFAFPKELFRRLCCLDVTVRLFLVQWRQRWEQKLEFPAVYSNRKSKTAVFQLTLQVLSPIHTGRARTNSNANPLM